MSKNGNMRHHRKLVVSSQDDIALCVETEDRFLNICGTWLRVKKEEIDIPQDVHADMYQWRVMRARHKKGDFRHTGAEMKALRNVAQWTLDMKKDVCNQPREQIKWRDD